MFHKENSPGENVLDYVASSTDINYNTHIPAVQFACCMWFYERDRARRTVKTIMKVTVR